ncbi:hypothetical protein BYT27DRAFT_7175388 [Phlegmacium glaucopus]|nr:hypothetical protein BYT27DRAFT_7175388 [Phlegmacium glaucopus]
MDAFPLPLPSKFPPEGFAYPDRAISEISTETAFKTGVKQRDTFNGQRCCVVCGVRPTSICYIIPQHEDETWAGLKKKGYVPRAAKSVEHEPRNGLSMCALHRSYFDRFFYIRYIPNTRQFLFVNQSGTEELVQYHGKAILLDMNHSHAPFPAAFLIHEQRIRSFWPFARPSIIPASAPFPEQDWIVSYAQDISSGGEIAPSDAGPSSATLKNESSGQTASDMGGQPPLNMIDLMLGEDTVSKILSATRNSASWKACVQEGTSWEGTAEENIAKYKENIEL